MEHNRPLFHWLKVPHNPYGGDPLHRAVAKAVLAWCAVPVAVEQRGDGGDENTANHRDVEGPQQAHTRPTVRPGHTDRLRQDALRCIAASIQIEQHLWPRNGLTVLGMWPCITAPCSCVAAFVIWICCWCRLRVGMLQLMLNWFSVEGYLCDTY